MYALIVFKKIKFMQRISDVADNSKKIYSLKSIATTLYSARGLIKYINTQKRYFRFSCRKT